jgi:dienelactone hydrolase
MESPGRVALLASAVLLAAGCGGATRGSPSAARSPFSYDAARPLRFQDHGRVNAGYPIPFDDVSYVSLGERIPGYLVVPPGRGRLPAVIWLHGSGGGRGALLVEAAWLAARGAVSLTITSPSSLAGAPPRGLAPLAELRREGDLALRDVIAVRRAVDLLQSLPRVDPKRIGLAGISLGARTGAIVAGVEPRVRDLVLMSGGALPVEAYVRQTPKPLRAAVARTLGQIDPLRYIGRGPRNGILLQDGRSDSVVPRAALVALARAAPPGTEVRWYPAGHLLNLQAFREQLDWLARKLGIHGPAVPGALTGP